MIQPTIGRIVLFHPQDQEHHGGSVIPAIVTKVWSDTCVNLTSFNANGSITAKSSVRLVQGGEEAADGDWCEWMPYQKGQAAKADELQKKLDDTGKPA